MIKINEIFFSIQGESTWSGLPTVFIRTSSCHLRCTYCDTKYAYYEGEPQALDQILEKVRSYGASRVCITGGEPLLQKEVFSLMTLLCDNGVQVSLETSGAVDCALVDPRVKKIIDVKTPDSGAANSFIHKNLEYLTSHDEVKFVICSPEDFEWSEDFCREHSLFEQNSVLFSPSFEQITPQWLAEKILSTRSRARLQLQLHKYIWTPETRGV